MPNPEVVIDTSKHTVDEAVEHLLGQLVAQRLLDPSIAALKGRPKLQARANPSVKKEEKPVKPEKPSKSAEKVEKDKASSAAKPQLVKVATVKKPAPKPAKAKLDAPIRKPAAAHTARAETPRIAAGGKRKR